MTGYRLSDLQISHFESWGNHPPFGIAVALLFLLSLAWGCTAAEFIVPRGTRKRKARTESPWTALSAFLLAGPVLWLAASFLSLCIFRLFNNGSSFDTIFCVLVFGGIPCFVMWISMVLRNTGYVANRCWQIASVVLLLWSAWITWTGFRLSCHANWWQAMLGALPLTMILWIISGFLIFKKPPDTFQSCHPWRRLHGKHVVAFYSGAKGSQEIEEIVNGADQTIQRVQELLKLEPLKFKVWLFLCRDLEQNHKLVFWNEDKSKTMAGGYAHHDSISLVYGKWDDIAHTVAHEFTHLVRRHRITTDLHGLLDEGLATYIAEKLHPGSTIPSITLAPNLQIVANTAIFFEWTRTDKPAMRSVYCYQHAQALADFLIAKYGLPRYFALCREVAESEEPTEGRQLAEAVEKIYGAPLSQVERVWRRTWPQYWEPGQIELDFGEDLTP